MRHFTLFAILSLFLVHCDAPRRADRGTRNTGGSEGEGEEGEGEEGEGEEGEGEGVAEGEGEEGEGEEGEGEEGEGEEGEGEGDPQPCVAIRGIADCQAAPECTWLAPGCGDGIDPPDLPADLTGCYPIRDCRTAGCDGEQICAEFVVNPCVGSDCEACGGMGLVCVDPSVVGEGEGEEGEGEEGEGEPLQCRGDEQCEGRPAPIRCLGGWSCDAEGDVEQADFRDDDGCIYQCGGPGPVDGDQCADFYYQVCASDDDCEREGWRCGEPVDGCLASVCNCEPETGELLCSADCGQGALCEPVAGEGEGELPEDDWFACEDAGDCAIFDAVEEGGACCDHCNGGFIVSVNHQFEQDAREAMEPADCAGVPCTRRGCAPHEPTCDDGICGSQPFGNGPPPQPPVCDQEMDEDACEAVGGLYGPHGMLGNVYCICPTSDGGAECNDGAECEGACLCEPEAEEGTPGVCDDFVQSFGCFGVMMDGFCPILCVD